VSRSCRGRSRASRSRGRRTRLSRSCRGRSRASRTRDGLSPGSPSPGCLGSCCRDRVKRGARGLRTGRRHAERDPCLPDPSAVARDRRHARRGTGPEVRRRLGQPRRRGQPSCPRRAAAGPPRTCAPRHPSVLSVRRTSCPPYCPGRWAAGSMSHPGRRPSQPARCPRGRPDPDGPSCRAGHTQSPPDRGCGSSRPWRLRRRHARPDRSGRPGVRRAHRPDSGRAATSRPGSRCHRRRGLHSRRVRQSRRDAIPGHATRRQDRRTAGQHHVPLRPGNPPRLIAIRTRSCLPAARPCCGTPSHRLARDHRRGRRAHTANRSPRARVPSPSSGILQLAYAPLVAAGSFASSPEPPAGPALLTDPVCQSQAPGRHSQRRQGDGAGPDRDRRHEAADRSTGT
jgi:hypothetical protein